MTDMEKLADAAMNWLGTPYVSGARVRGAGVDCGMLLLGAAEDAGLVARGSVSIAPYSNEWQLHHSEEWFYRYVARYARKIPLADIRRGDILLYQYGRCISHGAIYEGEGRVIHSLVDQGVVLSDMDDVMFKDARGRSRLRAVMRIMGGK